MKKYFPLILSAATGIAVVVGLAAYALYPTVPSLNQMDVSRATYLSIERLSIRAVVQEVGRVSGGAMGNPTNFYDVAWFREGPRPGETGSAVIAGHLDNALGLSGVFKNLDQIAEGDRVHYSSPETGKVEFRVVRVELYNYQEVPLTEVFDRTDGTYLNLITCAEEWLPESRTYSKRLVVYTEREF